MQREFNDFFDFLMNSNGVMADMSVDPNANVAQKTIASVMQEVSKPFMKQYCLSKLAQYAEANTDNKDRILDRIDKGALYPSDLHMMYAPYCWNFSVSNLMLKGLPFIPRIPSKPASHADSFVQHAIQLLMYASNHQSGAAALTSFFVGLDWYVRKDALSDREIKQLFQIFTYSINQPVRFSAQSPYVNLSVFDRFYLHRMYGDFVYPDLTGIDEESIQRLQRMYVEWFIEETEKTGNIFTFPVLTACLLLDENGSVRDEEFLDWLSSVNSKYGFINIYMSKNADSLSSCCRLRNGLGYINSFGSGGDGVGSIGVCSINLPHIALTEKDFFDALKSYAEDAQVVVEFRRKWVKENIAKGLFPLFDHGFMDLNRMYCTVGIVGLYEAWEILRQGDYMDFAREVLMTINEANEKRRLLTGYPYNLEQVPAENMAVYMAKKDRELGLQDRYDIYSNQWIPLTEDTDVINRIYVAGQLDSITTGGSILHVTTQGHVSPETHKNIVKLCAKMGVVYFALNYILSRCTECENVIVGEVPVCPDCHGTTFDRFTRVVGFITPVKNWKKERREEFAKRTRYEVEKEIAV